VAVLVVLVAVVVDHMVAVVGLVVIERLHSPQFRQQIIRLLWEKVVTDHLVHKVKMVEILLLRDRD
jgi:hypothetical protein